MRALVVKLSSLGDLFSAMPAVQLVRRHTGAVLEWVTQPEYVSLVRRVRGVERVIAYPRRDFFTAWPAFRRDLRSTPHDLVLDFQGLLKSALVCRLAGGARLIAPSFSREGSSFFLREKAAPAPGNPRHAVDLCLDTVRHLRLPVDRVEWGLDFPAVEIPGVPPHIALAPFSRPGRQELAPGMLPRTGRVSAPAGKPPPPLPGGRTADRACRSPRARTRAARVQPLFDATVSRTGGLRPHGPARHQRFRPYAHGLRQPAPASSPSSAPPTPAAWALHGDRLFFFFFFFVILQSPLFAPADRAGRLQVGDLKWMSCSIRRRFPRRPLHDFPGLTGRAPRSSPGNRPGTASGQPPGRSGMAGTAGSKGMNRERGRPG
ncbi:MAG: glycosyltransferase family 9 protein [Kiritimatiellia bacterium]